MNKASGGDRIPAELFQILKADAMKLLHSICHQIWKTQQWPQDLKSSVLIPVQRKGNAKECSNYHTIALISHASQFISVQLSCLVVSDSVRPHKWSPTRLPRPWDSPGKNIGVACHFLLQCMKLKSESEVAQLSPTLGAPMDYSLPGSSNHGIFQARVLEWGAIVR